MARRRTRAPLSAYLNARLVGRLRRHASGAIDFHYDESWLGWEHSLPISMSLPLREDRYTGDPVIAVFDNLLPDNEPIRRRVANRSRLTAMTPSACWPRLAAIVSARCSSCLRGRSPARQGRWRGVP